MVDTRRTFHNDIDEICSEIVSLGSLVVELIPRGTQVLLDSDLAGAEQLIIADDEVDLATLQLDERIVQVMTLQAPVASDFRRLVTAMHLIAEIERSADLVTNIAKATRRLHGSPLDPKLRGLLEKMGVEAQRLFRAAVDSFADRDAALASALDDMDDKMDELHGDFIAALFESSHADGDIAAAVQLALVGRYYERIGDHAVNIGERVAYMVTGWLPEHSGAARAEARRRSSGDDDETTGPDPAERTINGDGPAEV